MIVKETREAVIAIAKSRENKNQYTQGDKRTQVGSGWSDCSSFARWCYLQILGRDIGGNTAAQIVNKALEVVDNSGWKYPDEAKLLPGDLLYYKGTDKSRLYQVGHIELFIGDGKLLGHGSGVGPTIKNLKTYSTSRYNSGKGYIRTLRVIPAEDKQPVIPADPMNTSPSSQTGQKGDIRITGTKVNIRIGPGTSYDVARIAKAGEIYTPINTAGWRPIQLYDDVCWVSETLSEVID